MYSFFEIHGIVLVILDLPLRLLIRVVHLCKHQVSPGAVRVLWHVENHIVISLLEIIECAVEFFKVERGKADVRAGRGGDRRHAGVVERVAVPHVVYVAQIDCVRGVIHEHRVARLCHPRVRHTVHVVRVIIDCVLGIILSISLSQFPVSNQLVVVIRVKPLCARK